MSKTLQGHRTKVNKIQKTEAPTYKLRKIAIGTTG